MQEYIEGPDDAHFDIHIYMDRSSQPVAYFTGQKIRICPAYAGSGCYVRSVIVEPLVRITVSMLQAVGYHGLANINFKRDVRDGEYKLMEINPRVSQWNILPTECGVNLPYVAYADAAGLEYSRPGRQIENLEYISLRNDLRAFREYRRNGDWTWKTYLESLLKGRKVHQFYASDDLKPFALEAWAIFRSVLNRMRPKGSISGA